LRRSYGIGDNTISNQAKQGSPGVSSEVVFDRRKSQRKRVLIAGSIRGLSKLTAFDCTVRNLSERGAMIDLGEVAYLPDSFELDMPHRGVRHAAYVRWQTGRLIGVCFDPPPALPPGARQPVERDRLN
jgi:hypothetical protein